MNSQLTSSAKEYAKERLEKMNFPTAKPEPDTIRSLINNLKSHQDETMHRINGLKDKFQYVCCEYPQVNPEPANLQPAPCELSDQLLNLIAGQSLINQIIDSIHNSSIV